MTSQLLPDNPGKAEESNRTTDITITSRPSLAEPPHCMREMIDSALWITES